MFYYLTLFSKMDEDTVKQRLINFLSQERITKAEFGRRIGVSSAFITSMRKSIQPDKLKAIASEFPELNTDWLMTGKGEMLKGEEIRSTVEEARQVTESPYMNVVYVPIHAQAGYGKGYGDVEYIENLPTIPVIVDKHYNGKYRVFEVEGDSMDDGSRDSICDGDKILCREVKSEFWKSKLHIRTWSNFIIAMKNNGILVKQIVEHDVDAGKITCHSLNPMFNDFEVDLREVGELYNVIKIVERNLR